jgi:hypothetical protein
MAVKVLHGSAGAGTIADVVDGLAYAIEGGARIVNCSFGQPGESRLLEEALADADARGVLVVTAAGNGGTEVGTSGLADPLGALVMPASIRTPNHLSVAAVDAAGALVPQSNRGARTVDVAAPGLDVLSTVVRCAAVAGGGCVGGAPPVMGYAALSGTSMAAPHVAGLAALLWSRYPELSHRQVKARILNGVAPLEALAGETITGGRIDAAASLALDAELPAVFRVSPYFALAGEEVTVSGANFGAAPGVVTIAGAPLAVRAWSDETIVAVVPGGASSGPVQVNGEGAAFPLAIGGAPSVALAATPLAGTAPVEVTFTATVADEEGDVVRYEWDFGDGTFREYEGVTTSALVTYAGGGVYLARARVTDSAGRSATAQLRVLAGGDSRCFVATAAYGTPLHPEVRALRSFRDRVLVSSAPGRALVRAYYALSPPLADAIRGHAALGALARAALAPLVFAVAHPLAALAAALALAAVPLVLRRTGPSGRASSRPGR